MSEDVLESVVEGIAQLNEKCETEYLELVKKTGDGKRVAPQDAKRILDAAEKTTADLAVAVALYQRRQQLKREIADAAKATSDRPPVEQRMQKVNEELAAAQKKHADAIWPLQCEIDKLNHIIGKAAMNNSELVLTCPDGKLRARMKNLDAKVAQLNHTRQAAEDSWNRVKAALAYELAQPSAATSGHWRSSDDALGGDPETVRELQATVDRAKSRLDEIDAAKAVADQERSEIETAMMAA